MHTSWQYTLHEPYLRSMPGFVMQRTDFAFVAFILNNASTDKFEEIIHVFAEKYLNIIKLIYSFVCSYYKEMLQRVDLSFGLVIMLLYYFSMGRKYYGFKIIKVISCSQIKIC